MLFYLFIILLVVGIVCLRALESINPYDYDLEWLGYIGYTLIVISVAVIVVCGIIFIFSYCGLDAHIASDLQTYESLVYQLENNIYDNDNDIGKKQLYDEIQKWNENLAYHKNIQKDFWLGIFYPNIYDQFDFIEYH